MKMRDLFSAALTAICIALLALPAFAQVEQEDVLKASFSNPAAPKKVKLGWRNGDITIRGYEGADVEVNLLGRSRRSREETAKARGLRKIFDGDSVDIKEVDNTITITSFSTYNDVDAEILIPRDAMLFAENALNGDITIENITTDIEVSTLNGEILLRNVSGSIVAHSVNGNIEAVMENITTDEPMAFSTINSDIDLTLPPTINATLLMSTSDEIYSDFEFTTGETQTTRRRTWSSKKEYLVNGGGLRIEIGTVHGTIYVRQGK